MAGYLPEPIFETTIVTMSSSTGINVDMALDRKGILRYQPLLIVLVAACAGIVADSYRPLSFMTWFTTALAALGIWCLTGKTGVSSGGSRFDFIGNPVCGGRVAPLPMESV